jgi:hypothetical protein
MGKRKGMAAVLLAAALASCTFDAGDRTSSGRSIGVDGGSSWSSVEPDRPSSLSSGAASSSLSSSSGSSSSEEGRLLAPDTYKAAAMQCSVTTKGSGSIAREMSGIFITASCGWPEKDSASGETLATAQRKHPAALKARNDSLRAEAEKAFESILSAIKGQGLLEAGAEVRLTPVGSIGSLGADPWSLLAAGDAAVTAAGPDQSLSELAAEAVSKLDGWITGTDADAPEKAPALAGILVGAEDRGTISGQLQLSLSRYSAAASDPTLIGRKIGIGIEAPLTPSVRTVELLLLKRLLSPATEALISAEPEQMKRVPSSDAAAVHEAEETTAKFQSDSLSAASAVSSALSSSLAADGLAGIQETDDEAMEASVESSFGESYRAKYASLYPTSILGFEGSLLRGDEVVRKMISPSANGTQIGLGDVTSDWLLRYDRARNWLGQLISVAKGGAVTDGRMKDLLYLLGRDRPLNFSLKSSEEVLDDSGAVDRSVGIGQYGCPWIEMGEAEGDSLLIPMAMHDSIDGRRPDAAGRMDYSFTAEGTLASSSSCVRFPNASYNPYGTGSMLGTDGSDPFSLSGSSGIEADASSEIRLKGAKLAFSCGGTSISETSASFARPAGTAASYSISLVGAQGEAGSMHQTSAAHPDGSIELESSMKAVWLMTASGSGPTDRPFGASGTLTAETVFSVRIGADGTAEASKSFRLTAEGDGRTAAWGCVDDMLPLPAGKARQTAAGYSSGTGTLIEFAPS